MTETQALRLMESVRRAGAELIDGLRELEAEPPADLQKWQLAVASVMGGIQDELLEPIFEEHPQIRPQSLGGGPTR